MPYRTRSAPVLAVLLLALALAGCAAKSGERYQTERAQVRVQNNAWVDMNMFIVRGAQRIRLGTVPSNGARVFPLPSSVVGTGAVVRFTGDPVGGRYEPYSMEMTIRPGATVTLTIPYRSY